jgi:hypothetical protein
MKPVLLALLVFALPAHAATTCTGIVKQIADDVGTSNPRVYVVLTNGAGLNMSQQGDAYKMVLSMAQLSKSTGEPISIVFAADVNCAGAGVRTNVVRVLTTAEGGSMVVN